MKEELKEEIEAEIPQEGENLVNKEEQEEAIAEQMSQLLGTTPTSDEKHNVHTFLHNVAVADDTTKTSFLSEEELGAMQFTVRGYKEMAHISDNIIGNPFFSEFFKKESEIMTSTALSKNAKLLNLGVVSRKEVADMTDRKVKVNKSWFKKKDEREIEE